MPPEKYDSSSSTAAYRLWREKFRALIDAQDDGIDWDEVLDFIEAKRSVILSEAEVDKIARKFSWSRSELKIVQ